MKRRFISVNGVGRLVRCCAEFTGILRDFFHSLREVSFGDWRRLSIISHVPAV